MKIFYYLILLTLFSSCNEKKSDEDVTISSTDFKDNINLVNWLRKNELATQDTVVYLKMEKLFDSLPENEQSELIDLIKYRYELLDEEGFIDKMDSNREEY